MGTISVPWDNRRASSKLELPVDDNDYNWNRDK